MAQRTVSAFKSTKNSRFADNTTGLISEGDSRDMYEDVADSFLNISDHFIDEDSFASDSATKVPSQQSVKAYVDAQAGGGSIDTSTRIFEDFYGAVQYFSLAAINNGGGLPSAATTSSYGVDSTEKAIGVVIMNTGTSTAGSSALSNSTWLLTFGFGYTFNLTWRVALKDLSDGTDTFTVRHGFTNSNSGTSTNGAYFRYTHSVNSGKWQAVTVKGGSETAEDTGVAGAVDGFHIFKIVVNDDATQVDFYIDGVKTNDITTTIPNSASELTGYSCHIEKTAGSSAKGVYADYFELIATRTTAR